MTLTTATSPTYRRRRGSTTSRDGVFWTIIGLASILSVVAFVVTYQHGNVLTYNDAVSHMMIARRVVSSNNPGLAQLGSVWLPLQHILMLPLVAFDSLYYSGVAGAVISMLSFVASCGLIYKTLHRLTGTKLPGVVAAIVFAANVNVLYMQSTPMTELPLFAALLGTIYCLQVWTDTYRYGYLVGAGVSALAATLTRYESWPILAVLVLVVVVAALREPRAFPGWKARMGRMQDIAIIFLVASSVGIVGWLIWNQALFGDALTFQNGEYAKPSLWVTNNEPAIGDWSLSAKTFWYAMTENVSWPILLLAGIGLVVFIEIEMLKGRFHPRSLVVPSLLIIVPFFILAIYTGQRPLHVLQVNGDLYNTRFGLITILPAALFAGYVVGVFRKFPLLKFVVGTLVVAMAVGTSVTLLRQDDIVTWQDPKSALPSSRIAGQFDVVDYLKPVHDGGTTLMETFGNERIGFMAVPSNALVYEGTNKNDRWKRSLADPAGMNVEWVVMRCTPGYRDKVCDALNEGNNLVGYTLVYRHPSADYRIYRKGV